MGMCTAMEAGVGSQARVCRCTAGAASLKHVLVSESHHRDHGLAFVLLQLQRLACCQEILGAGGGGAG